jgi:glycosyltransferase involved in cell wall biosynthesis
VVIIPCHNEELSIRSVIEHVKESLPFAEIWVIDNASTDNTSRIALDIGVKVIYEPLRGKGYAVRRAFSLVGPGVTSICMLDGDDTYSTTELRTAVTMVETRNVDMVVGNRSTDTITQKANSAFRSGHVIGNRIFSYVFSTIFGVSISDTLSGWRVFSPGFVRSFTNGASGFEIEMELNAHAKVIDGYVLNLEVGYKPRLDGSESKLNTYRDGLKILRKLLALFRSERPFIAYSILATPWALFSIFAMHKVLSEYFNLHLVPNFPTLIAGVGSFIVSALLWSTGMILEKVRLNRSALSRSFYNLSTSID